MAERQRQFWDDWTDEKKARWFRYFTPEEFLASVQAQGLDIVCDDPDILQAVAELEVQAERLTALRVRGAA